MSKEISMIKGATYVVTPTVDGVVWMPDGTVIVSFVAGEQTSFMAPSDVVVVSDDDAVVCICFSPASLTVPGGGKANRDALQQHMADRSAHLSASERARLEGLIPDFSADDPPVPEGALPHAELREHLARFAQPGQSAVPSAVYVSRVPWARWDEEAAAWVNNASEVDEAVFGVPRKLMDNAGLRHECSTDTVEGVDDYNGKLWPFYWQHANYITDEFGVKYVTAIRGIHRSFDPCSQNVAAFGPAFWFFCCLEHSQRADGSWNTHDGTESGTPLFQLWGISTRPWEKLDASRRAELCSLGVTEADFHLWPECRQWDAESATSLPRAYWIHAAYLGGAEKQADGTYKLVSKRNLPLYGTLGHNSLNALYSYRAGFGGGACVQGFGALFDIVKNATKNSQSVHAGVTGGKASAVVAAAATATPGYVFPVAGQGVFEPGASVQLWNKNQDSNNPDYKVGYGVQRGRIEAIETRTLELADGSEAELLCLVIDPETVEPFVTRTTISEANALVAASSYACSYATLSAALSGETDVVIYPHDGSRTSLTDCRHAYRVQGTEYAVGMHVAVPDLVRVRGTGAIAVNIDGELSTPGTGSSVMLHAGPGVPRQSSGGLADFLANGYEPVALYETKSGYILNARLTPCGFVCPVDVGGSGSSDSTGHGDYAECYSGTYAIELMGNMNWETKGGFASFYSIATLANTRFDYCGRD